MSTPFFKKISYSELNLEMVKINFNLTLVEKSNLFANIPELECSAWRSETLDYNFPIALGSPSEKARSELIIAPILVDLRRQLKERVS